MPYEQKFKQVKSFTLFNFPQELVTFNSLLGDVTMPASGPAGLGFNSRWWRASTAQTDHRVLLNQDITEVCHLELQVYDAGYE